MTVKMKETREDVLERIKQYRLIKIKLAHHNFWHYCNAIEPDFYKEDRQYLIDFCNILQGVYEGRIKKPNGDPYSGVLISFPPRHGKSRTLKNFSAWMLGQQPTKSVIGVGYNAEMGLTFSRATRDVIGEERSPSKITHSDVFPNCKLKQGNKSVKSWALDGSFFSYLATGIDGTITGKGATLGLIIDDPIKNATIAFNEDELDKIYRKYTDTLKSRVESGGLTFIVQTRWSKKDLIGRILNSPEAENFFIVDYKAYNENTGEMLCESVLSKKKYAELQSTISDIIFKANYQQELMDLKGGLYRDLHKRLLESYEMPAKEDFEHIVAYCDVATSGSDYTALVIAGIIKDQAYILDMVYSQEDTDETERLVSNACRRNKVVLLVIESNAAGGIYAKNIRKQLSKKGAKTIVKTRHQRKNKISRLMMYAPYVSNNLWFRKDVTKNNIMQIRNDNDKQYVEAWEHLLGFKKDVKTNRHDDIEDALTGLIEVFLVEDEEDEEELDSVQIVVQKNRN